MTRPGWLQTWYHLVALTFVVLAALDDYPAFYIGLAVLVTLIRIEARLFPSNR